jgi:hypothetical protein
MCPQRGEISPLGRILLPLLGPFFCKKSPNYLSAILSKFVKKGKKNRPQFMQKQIQILVLNTFSGLIKSQCCRTSRNFFANEVDFIEVKARYFGQNLPISGQT